MRIEDVIGQRIREVREINDVTQGQLGERLGELLGREWSRQAVSTAEKGGRAFTAAELVAIAHALGTTVPRLMTPAVEVRAIELPGGVEIKRQEVTRSTLPRASTEKAFDQVDENLRAISQALQAIGEAAVTGTRHLGLAHGALGHAAESISMRIQDDLMERLPADLPERTRNEIRAQLRAQIEEGEE
ncbi:helix-turn-helix domain-containing protein [Actinomadura geliboluensis]|uniref:helix-turn-helix domain-containing protein n=1 Tax=Actinomadura geliboluensis TaxID=882440 RepID=UPI00371B51C4